MAKLVKEEGGVGFYENGEQIYFIQNKDLANRYAGQISAWVSHLYEKSWMSNENFYELAKVIQKKYPDNIINWQNTFFKIEKADYLNTLIQLKREVEGKTGEADFMEYIELGREENNEEVNQEINKIIVKKLQEHGLK